MYGFAYVFGFRDVCGVGVGLGCLLVRMFRAGVEGSESFELIYCVGYLVFFFRRLVSFESVVELWFDFFSI